MPTIIATVVHHRIYHLTCEAVADSFLVLPSFRRPPDECPTCSSGQLDLSMGAFSQLADQSVGEIYANWWYL